MPDQPPTYQQAVATPSTSSHLQPSSTGIPPAHRRSMEDESRPLPPGWIRQYDPSNNHQFFVDTNLEPPRSIWHHPYDDITYLKSLPASERERIESLTLHSPSHEDIIAADSDTEDPHHEPPHSSFAPLPPRPSTGRASSSTGASGQSNKFGRKIKDKLTGTTHEQREAERTRRAEQEAEMYQRHLAIRRAMQQAWETGTPQYIGKDPQGKEVYIEPPRGGPFSQGGGAYGYNPYAQGPYQQPNARFIPYPQPQYPYGRPYGGGYGYGMGLPLIGGLAGGALLGGLLF